MLFNTPEFIIFFIPDYQITVGKDGILEDPKVENQLP